MEIVVWILIGIVAGWLADVFVLGSRFGILEAGTIGVLGMFVGGWLAERLFDVSNVLPALSPTVVVVASLGAAILIGIINLRT